MLAESKAMKEGLSAGAIAGIAVATTLIVALPWGVTGCVSRHGKGQTNKSQHKKTQQLQGATCEEPQDTGIYQTCQWQPFLQPWHMQLMWILLITEWTVEIHVVTVMSCVLYHLYILRYDQNFMYLTNAISCVYMTWSACVAHVNKRVPHDAAHRPNL